MKIGGESRDRSDVQQFATRTPARRKFPRNPSAIRASRYSRNSNPSTRNASSANPYREGYNILREELYRKSWKFHPSNISPRIFHSKTRSTEDYYRRISRGLAPFFTVASIFFSPAVKEQGIDKFETSPILRRDISATRRNIVRR